MGLLPKTKQTTQTARRGRDGRHSHPFHSLTWTVLTRCLFGRLRAHTPPPTLCPRRAPVSEPDVAAAHPRWLKSPLVVPSNCGAHAHRRARREPEISSQQFIASRLRACDCQLSFFIYFFCSVFRIKLTKPRLAEAQPPTWKQQLFWQEKKLLMC